MALRQGFFTERAAYDAYRDLILGVFHLDLGPASPQNTSWVPFAYFDAAGRCVASLEAAVLSLVCDGADMTATGVRLVATDPAWRGQGLFRDLMERVLEWCAKASAGPCLLYTADPNLYRRFGFEPLAQHAFVGEMSPVSFAPDVRVLDLAQPDDERLVENMLFTRTAVSRQCAIVGAHALFMSRAAAGDDLILSYDADHGLIVVHELEDEGVTLVDIVAATIPPLDVVLRAIGGFPGGRMKTLFPPDLLGWEARTVPEETGLMARGPLPAAMTRPFMLPPTTEF